MTSDPGIERVREARRRTSREFGNDPKRMIEYLLTLEEKYRDRVRSPSPAEEDPEEEAA